ncbi:MAG: DUF4179 domain-containing protein [Oscillospiraceae bacterium]|nr:DUF4179 domain-containing protein [Oscillospiraceae bacterium]
MNGKDLLNAMTEINQEFIEEAEFSEIRIHPNKKRNIIRTVSAIVAVAVMGVTAGAVSEVFTHRETVENWLSGDSRQQLEEQGLVSNYIAENEYFRMTLETILNDGFTLYLIATLEPLDETAQEFLQENGSFTLNSDFYDADTGEMMHYHGSAGFHVENGKNLIEFQYGIESENISRSAEIAFSLSEKHYPDKNYLMEGLTIPIDLAPNLKVLEFQSESGESVYLSPFELYSRTQDCMTTPISRICLVKKNGFRIEIDDDFELSGLSSKGGASALVSEESDMKYSYLDFDKIINIDEYQAIEFKNMNNNEVITYTLKAE